jgi:tRNA pseudouridine synthase 10
MSLLAEARAVVDAGPVCDSCLGRVFADRSFGLTNDERGRGLRVAVALADDEPFAAVDPADCWVCEGHCGRFDAWADRALAALADRGDPDFETYQVGTRTPPLIEENDELLRLDAGVDPAAGERFKSNVNREVGKRIGRRTDTEVDFTRPDVQFTLDIANDTVEVQLNSAFVYGRYRKLKRDIPQTEWPCRECHASGRVGGRACEHCEGTGYLYEESVEELTAPVVRDVMDGTEATFHGAGREDVDARMLGTGRPFVVEVAEPQRRRVDVERLEGDINAFADGAVEVEGLRLARYGMVERVKELDASKTYRAAVAFGADVSEAALDDAVAELDGATIKQETPQRVDHRRASKIRTRAVLSARADHEDARQAIVEIHGEGGLYIKELISGDEGRTTPSLAGLLGVEATVTALDVLAVEGTDEPFEDEAFFLDGDVDSETDTDTDTSTVNHTDTDADAIDTDE